MTSEGPPGAVTEPEEARFPGTAGDDVPVPFVPISPLARPVRRRLRGSEATARADYRSGRASTRLMQGPSSSQAIVHTTAFVPMRSQGLVARTPS